MNTTGWDLSGTLLPAISRAPTSRRLQAPFFILLRRAVLPTAMQRFLRRAPDFVVSPLLSPGGWSGLPIRRRYQGEKRHFQEKYGHHLQAGAMKCREIDQSRL
jgi:hypothetical protein